MSKDVALYVVHMAEAMDRIVPALSSALGTELPGVVERSGVVDRAGWVRANTASFASLIGKLEHDLLDQVVPAGGGLTVAAMALANRWITTRQLGVLLGFMGQRVLGQYDLALLSAEAAPGRLLFVEENIRQTAKALGATHGVNASEVDPVKAIRELTGPGVDYAFEAIGLKRAAEQAFECLRPGGTATIVGMIPVGQKIELDGPAFLREKKVQGCSMGSNRFKVDMPRHVELYRQGRLKLDEMITRRGRLEDVNEAFRAMKAGEVARTVLMFE